MSEVKLPELPTIPYLPNSKSAEQEILSAWAHEYARQAVLQERERCARICEELRGFDEDDPGKAPANHIRLGAEPGDWIDDHWKLAEAIRKG
jgi:hypothetical protein